MALLSALLTQDQVVSPRAIDEAIARQATLGGDFETSLLEVGALGEDTLGRYVAAVHGLPHATREDVATADPVAVARLPRGLAERHQLIPLWVDAGRLVVAVAGPVSAAARAEVEAAVRLPIAPRVVTAVRLAWGLWRYFQLPLAPRLERLAARLAALPPGPVPAEVIVPLVSPRAGGRISVAALDALDAALAEDDAALAEDDAAPRPPSTPPPPPGLRRAVAASVRESGAGVSHPPAFNLPTTTPPLGMPTLAPTVASESTVPPPAVSIAPFAVSIEPPAVTRPAPPMAPTARPTAAGGAEPARAAPLVLALPPPKVPGLSPVPLESLPPPALEVWIDEGDGRLRDAHLSSLPPPPRGIPLDDALRRIDGATDRAGVSDAILAHVLERFAYAALFVVQGGHAVGVGAFGAGAPGAAVRAVSVDLERPSTFRLAFESNASEVARIEPGTLDAEVRSQLQREAAAEVVIAPIRIGARVALLLWADDGAQAPTALAMRDLDAFLRRGAAGFERLIAARKRPVRPTPSQLTLPALRPVERVALPDRAARLRALGSAFAQASQRPARSPRPSERPGPAPADPELSRAGVAPGLKATPVRAPADVCADLVRELLAGHGTSSGVIDTLLAHGELGLDAVFRAFPGPHPPRRPGGSVRALAADEGAPLLRAAVAFREAAAPRLVGALDDVDPEVRFCALACLAESVHPASLPAVVGRLFDEDPAVRAAALEVLRAHQPLPAFEGAGRVIRAALADARPAVRVSAVTALGELRDAESVPALMAALGDPDDDVVEAAHRALTVITRQDFGAHAAPWITWWAGAGQRHRVEWLIDALLHPTPAIRHEANEELKRLTGQYFGYYFNLPKRDRERVHQCYVAWWESEGAARLDGRPR